MFNKLPAATAELVKDKNFCGIHFIVVYHINTDIPITAIHNKNLLLLSTDSTCFGRVAHPQA
jgi:hypothetical protein